MKGRKQDAHVRATPLGEGRASDLTQSHEGMFRLLEALPVGVLVADGSGAALYANPRALELLGDEVGRVPAVGGRFRDVLDMYVAGTQQPYPMEASALAHALRGESVELDDLEVARGDGRIRLQVRGMPILDPRGGVEYALVCLTDITERERAHQLLDSRAEELERRTGELEESQERFRSLAEAAVEGVAISVGGRIIECNEALAAMVGYEREELIGMLATELVHPDSREQLLDRLRKGRVEPEELIGQRRDGSCFVVEVRSRQMLFRGQAVRVAILRDLTERLAAEAAVRESEARLRTILDTSLNSIISMNLDGAITGWNRQAETLLGWRAEEVVGRKLADTIVPPQHREAHRRGLEHYRRTGEGPVLGQVIELSALRRDGTEFPVVLAISPAQTGADGSVSFVAFMRDISERKRAEELLLEHARELERSNREFEQFAQAASHDLQEPLRMVAGYVQLLARRHGGRLGPEADEYIGFAVDGARRMQVLINDLLSYARVGHATTPPEMVDLRSCVDGAATNLTAAIDEAGAEIDYTSLPSVRAHATQLTQLFQNLIGNAIKFRREEPPQVRISADRSDGSWIISVADNGIGIDPEQRDRVFQAFERLHTRGEYSGSGLGLAICKKIAEGHGGRIWVESEPGSGSTFRVSLPAP